MKSRREARYELRPSDVVLAWLSLAAGIAVLGTGAWMLWYGISAPDTGVDVRIFVCCFFGTWAAVFGLMLSVYGATEVRRETRK